MGYGLGVYSFFNQGVNIVANSGILAPVATGVKFTDALTVFLAGSGQPSYTIASNNGTSDNARGTTVQSGSILSDVSSWGGSGRQLHGGSQCSRKAYGYGDFEQRNQRNVGRQHGGDRPAL